MLGKKEARKSEKECGDESKGQSDAVVSFEDGRGLWVKKSRQPLQAGKGKETDTDPELPEGTESCWHLGFSPASSISDSWFGDCKMC